MPDSGGDGVRSAGEDGFRRSDRPQDEDGEDSGAGGARRRGGGADG